MGRLIDADALMKDIIKRFGCRPYIEVGNKYEYIETIIDEQPTAFDADMVYRQMWRESEEVCGNTMIDLEVADEIIRNGGKE